MRILHICLIVGLVVASMNLISPTASAQDDTAPKPTMIKSLMLRYIVAEEAAKLIHTQFPADAHPNLRVAADPRTNTLIVSANEVDHEALEAMIQLLDRQVAAHQAESIRVAVRIIWMVDADTLPNPVDNEKLRDAPEDIRKFFGEKLSDRLGWTMPRMGGRLEIQTQVSDDETIPGDFDIVGNNAVASLLRGSGEVDQIGPDKFRIRSEIEVKTAGENAGNMAVGSTIDLKAGHPVMLAATTIGGIESVFVIQVFVDED